MCWSLLSIGILCNKKSDLPYTWKFSPGENCHHLLSFLSSVNEYDMVTFTALAKIYSVPGLGKPFVQWKFLHIILWYMYMYMHVDSIDRACSP